MRAPDGFFITATILLAPTIPAVRSSVTSLMRTLGDMNMFTDREASNALNPTELVGIAVHWRNTELAFYREVDRQIDRSGLIQNYMAVQLLFSFDVSKRALKALGSLR